jgi:hypothetical protein
MNSDEKFAEKLTVETPECCCSCTDVKENIANEAEITSAITFSSKKYIQGSIVWVICLLLLIPSYLDTKVPAIAVLIPLVGLLAVYFFLEGKRNGVTLTSDGIEMINRKQFSFGKQIIPFEKIHKLVVDIIREEKEDVVNTIKLITDKDTVHLPDIDEKEKFLEQLNVVNKKLTIETIYDLTEKQKKQVGSLMIFSVFIAILGIIYNLFLAPGSADTAAFLSILKGGFIGYIVGIILWFSLFNLKGYYDKG